jgi:acyl-CoA synthetase (AMP-forming)/AMP-acid ligase II
MPNRKLSVTALVKRNSLSFVENVFALNAARQPFVMVSDEAFAETLTGLHIARCIEPDAGSGWFTQRHALIRDDQPAQITYTSGTEGQPKGVVLSYSNLADAAERIIQQMDLTPEVREYVGIPVTYSFGLGRIRAVSAAGGQSYLPPRGFDPLELARMLAADEVNALSAVPTLLRILLQTPTLIGAAGDKLRWLEIGSQYMTGDEKRAIRALFPNARIVQHYGLTEASRSTFLQISEVPEDVLESVGTAVGATEIGISEHGRIRIRGPHVARWRVAADHLVDLCGSDGWLETDDLGHLKGGYLYYDGRADDLINIGGVKIIPDMLEARIGQMLGEGATVVVAKVPDALRGEGVLVATESAALALDRLRSVATDALREFGVSAGDALHVRTMAAMPRTATGKPVRRLLTDEFMQTRVAAKVAPAADPAVASSAADMQTFFEQFFPGRKIGRQDSFESLGGDSLSYIQFSLGFESRFGALPDAWESRTVAQLEQSAVPGGGGLWRQLPSATLTRAFFMICIVALHFDTFIYSRTWGAAYFLFILCGYSVMRFQWPEISRTGKVDTIFGTVVRVAIPTISVIIVMQLLARTFELKPLLLISNLFDPSQYKVAYYYFAELFIQLLLILAALLSIPAVRGWLRKDPMVTCTAFLCVAIIVSSFVNQIWNTNYIYHRTPIWYLWTVPCGMLIATARSLQNRVLTMVIVSIAVLMHHGFSSASAYITGGCALLLFVPNIPSPSVIKTIVSEIAGSSMFLYLSHSQVRSVVIRLFHRQMPLLALFVAIVVGIVFSRSYTWLERKAFTWAKMSWESLGGRLVHAVPTVISTHTDASAGFRD